MLYNNNLCKLTVFKKYSNRSSTAALEWYLNNFLRGGGCWGGNFDFKVFIFSFSKITSLSLKKNLARWPDINCRQCSLAFRSFVYSQKWSWSPLSGQVHKWIVNLNRGYLTHLKKKTGARIHISNIERDKEKGSEKEFTLMLSVGLRTYVARNFWWSRPKFYHAQQHPNIFIPLVSSHHRLKNDKYYIYTLLQFRAT